MGKPTPSSHVSTLSSKLLLMIHDASETLLAREEADRISAELSNGPRYTSGGSRKRKRVEGGLGGGVLAELAEDLDVDDERAKALVSALVRHIRLKRRPPPPNPSLRVRPSADTAHLFSRSPPTSSSRPEPSSSASRPRSLLPQPRSGPSSSSATTAADIAGRLGSTAPSRRFLSSSSRPHFRTHSPDYEYHSNGVGIAPIYSSSSPPRSTAAAAATTSNPTWTFGEARGDDEQGHESPLFPPQSPPWQPAEELHIPPEELASYRAMRAQFYSEQARDHPPSQRERPFDLNHRSLADFDYRPYGYEISYGYHSRLLPNNNGDHPAGALLSDASLLDARALGFGPLAMDRYDEEDASESGSESGDDGREEGGASGRSLDLDAAASAILSGMMGTLESNEEDGRAQRRQRVPQISISLSPPPPGSGSGSGTGGSRWGRREGDEEDV